MTQRHAVFNSWTNYYNTGLGQSLTASIDDVTPCTPCIVASPLGKLWPITVHAPTKNSETTWHFLEWEAADGGNIVTMTNRLTLNRALNTPITCNNMTCVYLPATAWNARFIAGYCSTAGHTTNRRINRRSARVTSWTTTQTVASDNPIVSPTTSKYAPQA